MMPSLQGKTALVTGASRGIGREIALRLAEGGALVCAHYGRGRAEADETVGMIERRNGRAFALGADLSKNSEIAALFAALDGELAKRDTSGLDILVNNAGIGAGGGLADTDEALFDLLIDTNLKGTFFTAQQAVRRMRDGGSIINISSMVSIVAYPQCYAYAISKAGVNAFTLSLAKDLGPRRINVNTVAPGATATDFAGGAAKNPDFAPVLAASTAFGRVGQAEDIGGVVAFLASSDGAWITGQTIQASGGMHL
jgi:3-oxoacyl-[acyl-carrier protein] reductase